MAADDYRRSAPLTNFVYANDPDRHAHNVGAGGLLFLLLGHGPRNRNRGGSRIGFHEVSQGIVMVYRKLQPVLHGWRLTARWYLPVNDETGTTRTEVDYLDLQPLRHTGGVGRLDVQGRIWNANIHPNIFPKLGPSDRFRTV